MSGFLSAVPGWIIAILIIALVIFVGQALHLFTIHFSFSIP